MFYHVWYHWVSSHGSTFSCVWNQSVYNAPLCVFTCILTRSELHHCLPSLSTRTVALLPPVCITVYLNTFQVLQESIRMPGTEVYLVYHSSDTPGYMSTIMIQLTPERVPRNLSIIQLRVSVEGLVFQKTFEADSELKYKFAWDRRNAYNQKVYGIVTATGPFFKNAFVSFHTILIVTIRVITYVRKVKGSVL